MLAATDHRRSFVGTMLVAMCAAVLLVPLAGCVHGDAPYRPVQLESGEAALYLYRPRSMLSPGSVSVHVDQQQVALLRRNTHVVVLVPPGEHLVRVQRWSDATRRVRLGSGESLILEVGAALVGGKVSLSDPGEAVAQSRIVRTLAITPPVKIGSRESATGEN